MAKDPPGFFSSLCSCFLSSDSRSTPLLDDDGCERSSSRSWSGDDEQVSGPEFPAGEESESEGSLILFPTLETIGEEEPSTKPSDHITIVSTQKVTRPTEGTKVPFEHTAQDQHSNSPITMKRSDPTCSVPDVTKKQVAVSDPDVSKADTESLTNVLVEYIPHEQYSNFPIEMKRGDPTYSVPDVTGKQVAVSDPGMTSENIQGQTKEYSDSGISCWSSASKPLVDNVAKISSESLAEVLFDNTPYEQYCDPPAQTEWEDPVHGTPGEADIQAAYPDEDPLLHVLSIDSGSVSPPLLSKAPGKRKKWKFLKGFSLKKSKLKSKPLSVHMPGRHSQSVPDLHHHNFDEDSMSTSSIISGHSACLLLTSNEDLIDSDIRSKKVELNMKNFYQISQYQD